MSPDSNAGISAALGRIPSGVFVVTYRRGDSDAAFLGSWIQQCAFDPPMLSMAVGGGRDAADWLIDGAPFAVNILAEDQKEILSHFGRGLPLSQLPNAGKRIRCVDGSAAALTDAHAVLHCHVAGRIATGDHHLIIGRIIIGSLQTEERPYVHIRKSGMNY